MARIAHEIIMGRADDSLLVDYRPPLSPQDRINVTQFGRLKFGYRNRRLTPTESSTLVTFDEAQPSDAEVVDYIHGLTTVWNRPIILLGELVSRQIPEMATGRSLFLQREKTVASVREQSPSVRDLVGSDDEIAEDVDNADNMIRQTAAELADPYGENNGAFMWATIGLVNSVYVEMVNDNGVHLAINYHGKKDTDKVKEDAGLVTPDGALHSFAGPNGFILRRTGSLLALKAGPEKAVPPGTKIPVRSLLARAEYVLETI